MSTRPSPETAVRQAVWLGGLLIVLGGLFGMHGLGTHGVESAEHASMAVAAVHGAADHQTMTGATEGTTSAWSATSATGHSGMDMHMGMCVAILVLGLLALLLRINLGRTQRAWWLVARAIRMPEAHGRAPDPPSLIRLSIQRC